ncbi:hypothetical protein TNCV_1409861 [Trichonephila clavipes]|uniref:Uncharacterized protein n=1 Tax=Trichonephila clavipes TaxID=2585209 RepID=A0A8X6UYQ8_TRICX|nr:hypothetical protein TNCV_1409861 [Trichonephila clavipes]
MRHSLTSEMQRQEIVTGIEDPGREIICCSYQRLIHKRFQVAPQEETQRIKVRRAWSPSNRSPTTKLPPGLCSMNGIMHRDRKIRTIVLEIYVLVRRGR